jgi:hypothetical protein
MLKKLKLLSKLSIVAIALAPAVSLASCSENFDDADYLRSYNGSKVSISRAIDNPVSINNGNFVIFVSQSSCVGCVQAFHSNPSAPAGKNLKFDYNTSVGQIYKNITMENFSIFMYEIHNSKSFENNPVSNRFFEYAKILNNGLNAETPSYIVYRNGFFSKRGSFPGNTSDTKVIFKQIIS